MNIRGYIAIALLCAAALGGGEPDSGPGLSPQATAALDRISAQSLKGNLSFLASDLLEGRNTPSRGLNIAAEFIASQFRRAGLEAVGDDGYYQTADYIAGAPDVNNFHLSIQNDGDGISIEREDAEVHASGAVDLSNAPAIKYTRDLKAEEAAGKVVLVDLPNARLRSFKPAAIVTVAPAEGEKRGGDPLALVDPGRESVLPPLVTVSGGQFRAWLEKLPAGAEARVNLSFRAAAEPHVKVRNVIGLLRGSDPTLKETYVLVTAHYDHIGMAGPGPDRIYNGANDDGSGVASVIELAYTLAQMKPAPKRSIVFAAFYGEEAGLFGSRYYARHPVFPLEKTVAAVELEQIGRTDDAAGPQEGKATLTGFDYSSVPEVFVRAGQRTGITVYKRETDADDYFRRSDNYPLAQAGIPAHTLVVALEFPDYHEPGDEWQKIDYANMAKIDRMVALALITLAEAAEAPRWNQNMPATEPYRKARETGRP